MPPQVASIVCAIIIAALFFLDRGEKSRVSTAMWIPIVWLFFCTTRDVDQWLGMTLRQTDDAGVYLEGNPLDRVLLEVLEIGALAVVVSRWARTGIILRRSWAVALFFCYAALSIAWSDFPFVTLKHWVKGVGDVMMVLIVLTEPSITGAIRRLFTRLAFVLLPLSVLWSRFYPALGRTRVSYEVIGVCETKNTLGMLCDTFGLALLWFFRSAYNDREDPTRSRRLLALGVSLGLIVWLLVMCNSLTSICALAMASIVMLLSGHPAVRRRPALLHLLISGLLAFAIYALFFQSSGSLKESLGRDATMSGRTDAWPIMLSIPNNRLVGAGYESFWLGPRLLRMWDAFDGYKVSEAHNGYIEMLLILGWVGVAFLGVLIATGYRNVIRAYRHSPEIGGLRIAFFLATIITGFSEAAFRMMSPTMIVFLLATASTSWRLAQKEPAGVPSTGDLPGSAPDSDFSREWAYDRLSREPAVDFWGR
jgi:O-antigen ligase